METMFRSYYILAGFIVFHLLFRLILRQLWLTLKLVLLFKRRSFLRPEGKHIGIKGVI